MALSSIASANSFFSFAFSSARTWRRRASDTSRPPYLPFHCKRRAADPVLALDIPRLRTRFMFSQDRNDPFFREPRLLHLRLPHDLRLSNRTVFV